MNLESHIKQEDIKNDIESRLNSDNLLDRLEIAKLIPEIIDPIYKDKIELSIFNTIIKVFNESNPQSRESIDLVIKAMNAIDYLDGNFKNDALKNASRVYFIFTRALKIRPHDKNLIHFFIEIDDMYPSYIFSNLKKQPKKLVNPNKKEELENHELTEEEYESISDKEKIEWTLHLLRSNSWSEITTAVKFYEHIQDDGENKIPKILTESIEKKIFDLIALGLRCKEEDLEKRLADNGVGGKKIEYHDIPPLERNSLYANLVAIELIPHVSEKYQKELIKIAEENTSLEGIAKEKLEKIKVASPDKLKMPL